MTQTMTKTSIPETVGKDLQDTVLELIDLALQAKQAHWTVTGPHFRALHLQLDDMVAEYRAWTDEVAERAVALGHAVDGRAGTVAQSSPVEAYPSGWSKDDDVISLFISRLDNEIARVRERVQNLDDKDLVSQDLLIDITRGIEKQRWMLAAQRA